jgi:hypothetical protein
VDVLATLFGDGRETRRRFAPLQTSKSLVFRIRQHSTLEVLGMGLIERELERVSEAVRARQAEHSDTDEYRQLYAAQQALS